MGNLSRSPVFISYDYLQPVFKALNYKGLLLGPKNLIHNNCDWLRAPDCQPPTLSYRHFDRVQNQCEIWLALMPRLIETPRILKITRFFSSSLLKMPSWSDPSCTCCSPSYCTLLAKVTVNIKPFLISPTVTVSVITKSTNYMAIQKLAKRQWKF